MARLLYFGRLMDSLGKSSEDITLGDDVSDTQALRRWLGTREAAREVFDDVTVRIALNGEIVAEPAEIADGDEIAFLPPVGGG